MDYRLVLILVIFLQNLTYRDNQGNNFCIPIGMGRGQPDALGVTWNRDGSVNFALYSRHAENVVLCLYESDAIEPSVSIGVKYLKTIMSELL